MKRNLLQLSHALVALLLAAAAVPVHADQAPFGPLEGRAALIQVETVTQGGATLSTVAYLDLHVSISGHSGTREIVCENDAQNPDIRQTYCTPSAFLGNCPKTWSTYKSYGPNGVVISGTITYCTNPGAGACRSLEGFIDENNRLRLTAASSIGGCQ